MQVGQRRAHRARLVADQPGLAGLPTSVPFLVLFVALLVTPPARLAVRSAVPRVRLARIRAGWSPPAGW